MYMYIYIYTYITIFIYVSIMMREACEAGGSACKTSTWIQMLFKRGFRELSLEHVFFNQLNL